MKLLLHACCAPCLVYPLERLKDNGAQITWFFYNPNIHPFSEYKARRQAVEDYAKGQNLEVVFPEYNPEEFFQAINFKENKPQRCSPCWALRLKKTARAAKENNFDAFSTTLLVSPYQDQEELKRIGNTIAGEQGIKFYYEDFRPGFRQAHNQAKAQGMYCQKYCGCIYSMKPRLTEHK